MSETPTPTTEPSPWKRPPKQSHTGYNKEHIALKRFRTAPVELHRNNFIWNCQLERAKLMVVYACGLHDTYDQAHKWSPNPKNRKLCPQCAGIAPDRRAQLPEDHNLGDGYTPPETWNIYPFLIRG